jgi:hypothetical protein
VLALDRLAQEAWARAQADAAAAAARGRPPATDLAARVERDVLPRLRAARAVAAAAQDGGTGARLARTLRDLVAARTAAYAALAEALRTAGPEATVGARTRMEEADRLRREAEALPE